METSIQLLLLFLTLLALYIGTKLLISQEMSSPFHLLTVCKLFSQVGDKSPEEHLRENGAESSSSSRHLHLMPCGTRRCRIAIISDHADPALEKIGTEGAGGQNVYVRQLGEHLSRNGWTVDMFTRQWQEQDEIVIHNPYCRTIRLRAGPVRLVPRDQLLFHMREFLDSFLQFQSRNELSYDIIQTNYWLSGVVGLWLKSMNFSTPLVHVCHSLGRIKRNWLTNVPTNVSAISSSRLFAERDILENADLVIATSENEVDDIQAYAAPSVCHRKRNIVVIPCGVNSEQFVENGPTKSEARQALGLDPDSRLVLYVGRFDRRKGIDVLVEAIGQSQFRHDPKLSLVIAGGVTPGLEDEAEFLRIRELVHARNLQNITKFPGLLSHRDKSLQLRYAAADVVVVPSRYEPFGLVAIEAMGSGVPVIASAVGGLQSTVLDGETGFLVENGDYLGFARRIDQILKNPVLAKKLGTNGKERVRQHFTWDKVTPRIDYQLRQLLSRRQIGDNFQNQF